MAHNESDARQAEQLDKVVGNIIGGDWDLFQGVGAGDVSRETLELIDLATFILPPQDISDRGFEQRMCAFAVRGSHQELLRTAEGGQYASFQGMVMVHQAGSRDGVGRGRFLRSSVHGADARKSQHAFN